MLEEDRNRIIDSIRREIDSGSYRSCDSLYSDKCSSNVDYLVDNVIAKQGRRHKDNRISKKRKPIKEIVAIGLVLFVLLAIIPQLLPPLYGDFGSDAIISLDPDGVHLNETLFVNVSIPSSYNIANVSADMASVETIDLEVVDNTSSLHLWSGNWAVYGLGPGEHIMTVFARDDVNGSYSAGSRLSVLPDEIPVDNESSKPNSNETITPADLNLSLQSDKNVYFVNETVRIEGIVTYNKSLINASVNLLVFGPDYYVSEVLNFSFGTFVYQFVPVVDGDYNVLAKVSYKNDSVEKDLVLIVEDIPVINISENVTEVTIVDPKVDERIYALPGNSFYVERTVDGPQGLDVVFAPLYSDGLTIEKFEILRDNGATGLKDSSPQVFSAGGGVSNLERRIDGLREGLPVDVKSLNRVSYSQSFTIQDPITVRVWFRAPSWEEITSGLKPSSGKISYLTFSSNGSDGFDFESSTWWDSGWSYRKLITINSSQVPANLNNFPILVNITDTDLRDDAQDDGDDIAFVLYSDNTTQLNHEIELFNGTTGELFAWVNVTSLSSSVDTKIWMYYNNSGASSQENINDVWDSNYVMVQHLNETSGTHYDSTKYGSNGTNVGSTQDATGMVDGANSFAAANDIELVDDNLKPTDAVTLEVWAKATEAPAQWDGLAGLSETDDSWTEGYYLWFNSPTEIHFTINDYENYFASSSITTTNWNYVVGTYDKDAGGTDEIKVYVNSVKGGTTGDYSDVIAYAAAVGRINEVGGWQGIAGTIDEVRISNISRSASWINTCYNNQNNQSTFISFESEEEISIKIITNASTGVEETNATLMGWLQDNASADTTCYFLFNDTNDFGSPIFNLSKGVIADGAEFENDTAGETTLTKGKLYYVDTKANNSAGWNESGGVQTFLTKPDPPTGLNAQTNSSSMIYLTWSTGTGFNTTYIERNASGDTVWARGAGTEIYNGTGTNYEDTGLEYGTTYYYQAWSYANWTYDSTTLHQWSDENASANSTTNNPPTQSDESPTNGSTMIGITPGLYVVCSDNDAGDTLNATWWSNSTSSWAQFGSNETSFASGTNITQTNSNFTESFTTYWWSVNLTDSEGGWNNETYHFTTEIITSVDPIIPYEIKTSPHTINATGPAELDNVTLHYRYSSDNASWDVSSINWWNSNWGYRKLTTVNSSQIEADLTNFPMLVYNSSDTDLVNYAQSDGDDIVFILYSDNTTQINHEIALYNNSTGELAAWVNVTNLNSTFDTKIWMYYNNSACSSQENVADTWDSDYEIIWHLQESGNGTTDEYKDSTSDTCHGTGGKDDDSGGLGDATETPDRVNGRFGYAQDFNNDGATGDRISSQDLTSAWTAVTGSVWIYGNAADDDRIWGKSWGGGLTDNTILMRCTGTGANTLGCRFRTDTSQTTGYQPTSMENDNWIYMVLTWDGSDDDTVRIYKDGQLQGSGLSVSGTTLYGSPPHEFFTLGNVGDGASDRCFDGYIQEARMSSIRRSFDWIETEYNNQNNLTTFLSFDNYENINFSWVLWNNASNPDTSSPWSWNFDFPNGTGYYEFYSMGNKSGSPNETAPNNADAKCYFNPPLVPTIITYTPTGVEETNATLRGYLNSNGTLDTTCGFRFGTSSGSYSENFTKGIYPSNTEFNNNNGSLIQGQIYFYQAWANNSQGFANSTEMTFLTKPNPPTSLTAQANSTSVIYLNWTSGTGANNTYIERNASGASVWNRGEGIMIYNGSGINFEDSNLADGITFYYQAWSYANWTYDSNTLYQWSDINASANNATHDRPNIDLVNPSPNGTTAISILPICQIWANDSDSGTLDVYWYENSTGSHILKNTNSSVSANSIVNYTFTEFSNYSITYYWKVAVNDSTYNTTEWYYFTTKLINTSINSISPYIVTYSPYNLTVSGYSDLDKVTLWSQYSVDNSSWSGWMKNSSDTLSPWKWGFTFSNGTGYYEFYSIGNKSGSPNETAPGSADAKCYYNVSINNPPTQNNEVPANQSTGISLTPQLNVTVNDGDLDTLNATWWSNSSDSWIQFGSNLSIDTSSGPVNIIQTNSNFSDYENTYWWSVNLTDGTDWTNETYYFTTEPINTSVDTVTPYTVTVSPKTINATGPTGLDNVSLWYQYSTNNFSWWNSSWGYRKLTTVNSSQVKADLTNFPMLIYNSSDTALANYAQPDGDDIAFILYSDNTTKLNHEIALFNNSTGEIAAWVNVTSLNSSVDTKIWMYFNNSACSSQENVADTWDSDYEIIWHLQEDGNGTTDEYKDSSSNACNGTGGKDDDSGGLGDATETPDRVNGKFGYAQDLNVDGATGDRISSQDLTSAWTAVTGSVWIYGNAAGDDRIWGKTWGTGDTDHTILMNCIGTGANTLGCRFQTDIQNTPNYQPASMENNAWIYMVLTWDGNGSIDDLVRIYKNGQLQGSVSVSGTTLYGSPSHEFFTLGNNGDGAINRCFDGYIQEARMSSIRRSFDWIETEYNNQNNLTTFLSFDNYEKINFSWVLWNNASNPDTSSPWSWNFDFPNGTGYYEFYSIGNKSGSPNETAPGSADARCRYNNLPTIEVITPANGSTGISLQPMCQIWANDTYSDTLTVYWYENTTESWVLQQTNASVPVNSTVNWTFTQANAYGTTYYWKVAVNDSFDNTSAWFYFTTEPINTSIDAISPYEQTTSPLTINATNYTAVDNVTLWYRYSSDNSTWWNASWTSRMKLTVNSSQVNDDLANFPILVNITNNNLSNKAQADGDDIVFTNATGTKLNHEIENYTSGTGNLIAWVNLTSVSSSSDTDIYIYYGNSRCSNQQNPTGVWDSNYVGVWHLDEEESGTGNIGLYNDSTSKNNHGDDNVSDTGQLGQINGGQQFDGNGDYISVPHHSSLNLQGEMTISYWIYPTQNTGAWSRIIEKGLFGYQTSYYFGGGAGTNDLTFYLDNTEVFDTVDNVLQLNAWQHCAVNYSSSGDSTLFLNGTSIDSGSYSSGITGNSDSLYISFSNPTYDFPGYIDEVRISNIDRNASWINTCYNNQNNQSTFISTGNEEAWMEWDNSSQNPDTASPWSWDFDFPNSTGYYEFYSIGNKSGSPNETAPSSADAICHYEINTSIEVTPSQWDVGTTTIGSYNYSTSGFYFNLTNNGTGALNIQIKASNATNSTTGASWNLTSTPGFDNYSLQCNKSASWTNINQTFDTFVTNLVVSGWQTFDLNIFMATTSTKSDPLSLTVTFRSVVV